MKTVAAEALSELMDLGVRGETEDKTVDITNPLASEVALHTDH